ncbi:hypothetical protein MKX03_026112 [Papaver bracteatum]|nr:hypothetical protein MKX03_026112 [Papaver bracteatum]
MAYENMILLICLFTLLKVCSSQSFHNLTVATDGSGDYRTINEAVEASPSMSRSPYVIRIRKGSYKENVLIPQNKRNLVFRGEGMLTTKIIGHRSNASGYGTQDSATLIVLGDGFMARDIAIVNTAGPNGHQAVALISEADRCVFYRCRFEGYQDTLYAKINRQFYRECDILGTVDFIFGQSTTVLQNCNIYCRRPNQGQSITITADGRDTLKINSEIVLHNCSILASKGLERVKNHFRSYFGRPWRSYSTTIVMQSYIGDFISGEGWLPWSINDNKTLSTLTYIEYRNRGPGAKTKGRVKWGGFKVYNDSKHVLKYTVKNFINGNEWLPSTGVPFTAGLV